MDMKIQNENRTDLELIIAYAQMAVFTLQNSGTEITAKSLKSEIKMFYEKFGDKEVKRLANIIMKEKKERKRYDKLYYIFYDLFLTRNVCKRDYRFIRKEKRI